MLTLIIVSIYNIGCLLGCIANFAYGSGFGRRHVIWAAMGFISLGAVIQASAFSVPQLMVGRLITGFGTCVVLVYRYEADHGYRSRS